MENCYMKSTNISLEDQKIELICSLLCVSRITYKKYQQGISTSPIFYYLESCGIQKLIEIQNKIKSQTKKENYQNLEENDKTQVIHLTPYISITVPVKSDLSMNHFKAIFLKKDAEYKKQNKQKDDDEKKFHLEYPEKTVAERTKNLKKEFNQLHKKYIETKEDSKQEIILVQIIRLANVIKNIFSDGNNNSVSLLLGEKYNDLLPAISILQEKRSRNVTRPKITLNSDYSEDYIYLLEDTKRKFKNILERNIFKLEYLEGQEAFKKIWVEILILWAESITFRGDDINEIEDIFATPLEFEYLLFRYKCNYPTPIDLECIYNLFEYIQYECYNILEHS